MWCSTISALRANSSDRRDGRATVATTAHHAGEDGAIGDQHHGDDDEGEHRERPDQDAEGGTGDDPDVEAAATVFV